MEDKSKEEAK